MLKNTAGLRGEVTRTLFNTLPQAEKDKYVERARADANVARERWEALLKVPPSKKPEDRQK